MADLSVDKFLRGSKKNERGAQEIEYNKVLQPSARDEYMKIDRPEKNYEKYKDEISYDSLKYNKYQGD